MASERDEFPMLPPDVAHVEGLIPLDLTAKVRKTGRLYLRLDDAAGLAVLVTLLSETLALDYDAALVEAERRILKAREWIITRGE